MFAKNDKIFYKVKSEVKAEPFSCGKIQKALFFRQKKKILVKLKTCVCSYSALRGGVC